MLSEILIDYRFNYSTALQSIAASVRANEDLLFNSWTYLVSGEASVRANEDLLFNTSDAGNLIAQASVQVKQLFENNLGLRSHYPAALQRVHSLFKILDTVKDIKSPDILQMTFEAWWSAANALDEAPWGF